MFKDKILDFKRQLYPTGRAFRMPKNGVLYKLNDGLSESEGRLFDASASILDSILPDNDNFTSDDATRWEERLGLIVDPSGVSLDDRKAAILRKMNHPGTILARQSWDYVESQLRLAGFDVYIHENIPEQTPSEALESFLNVEMSDDAEMGEIEMGAAEDLNPDFYTFIEMGDIEMGEKAEMNGFFFSNIVANNIDSEKDENFEVGDNYRSTFFVGGEIFGTTADVDLARKKEFRQLILKLKPAQTVGLLFINYI